ncbi:hypothetical protein QBC38DRAFT_504463 [Podospora fimiseda]|uniref:Uncharacterized protein n=1 Tax=Podospora fimiseda TaxID=252190 RepID=A0AAN6YQ94_9PEZI|nr:hypothetical protein QBC38DRAFT_504463 [Podospora fimiseda]
MGIAVVLENRACKEVRPVVDGAEMSTIKHFRQTKLQHPAIRSHRNVASTKTEADLDNKTVQSEIFDFRLFPSAPRIWSTFRQTVPAPPIRPITTPRPRCPSTGPQAIESFRLDGAYDHINFRCSRHSGRITPALVPEEGDNTGDWGSVIRSLFKSGHPKWGFLIYRVHYGDNEAWERFMDILTRVSESRIRQSRKERLLPYLFWTKMEDRAAYEGASKDAIRQHFRHWVSTRSVERDRPGADNPPIADRSPRYQACLYVDKEVMDSATLREYPSFTNPTGLYLKVEGRVIVIDGQYGEHYLNHPGLNEYDLKEIEEEIAEGKMDWEDLEEDEYDPIDGKT